MSPVRRTVLVLAGAALLLVPATGAASAAPANRVDRFPTATSLVGGDPTVGAVFTDTGPVHACTASVVSSPAGDVIVGAAHCIVGSGTAVSFAPAYSKGAEPYGRWQVTGAYVDPSWVARQDPRHDVVFLTVAPRGGRSLQSVVGANLLGAAAPTGVTVTDIAYVGGSGDDAITCTNVLRTTGVYPTFDCHGYFGGTSGSPFLQSVSGVRFVDGVIGGLHQGGCQEYTSYSAPFDDSTYRTYARALSHAAPDVLPDPGSDGC